MKNGVKTVIVIFIVVGILALAAVCKKTLNSFDYKDHLDEAVINVDDVSITLREFGYYIYDVEAFVQKQALIYDPQNPKHWWNTHFSAGVDSQFVCDYAKNVAVNTCILDEIYYKNAVGQGITVSSLEEEQALDDAKDMYDSMNPKQLEATGLDMEIIVRMKKKHLLASKYAQYVIENENMSGYADEPEKLVNWDGEYYLNEILPKHAIQTNDKVMEKITLGKITVNCDLE